jgi:hypothetical protein
MACITKDGVERFVLTGKDIPKVFEAYWGYYIIDTFVSYVKLNWFIIWLNNPTFKKFVELLLNS